MPDLPNVPPPVVNPGFALPQAAVFPPAQSAASAPGTIPRGRPAADPEANEARIAKHQQKKELEAALPKRATEKKVLIYKDTKGTGRVPAASRPVLTVLLSDLMRVAEENKDLDENDVKQEYLAKKLIEKFGTDRVEEMAPFVCRVVDAQGNRISDIADWTLLDDDVNEEDLIEDEGAPEEEDFSEELPPRARGREEPPRAQALDVQQYDALAAANRREGENAMTPIVAMIQQQAQTAAQAQAQQMQMIMAILQNNQQQAQAAAAGNGGTIAAVLTALAPVLAQILKPKEDNTEKLLAILLPVLSGRGESSAETMKMIPQILGQVANQQMTLMGASAQQTVQLQGEATKHIVHTMMATMKDMQKEAHASAEGGGEGGGLMENLAKIAGPVIGAMMAPKAQPEPPAIEAPRLPPPRPRAPVKQAPPPAAPAAPRPTAEKAPAAPAPTPAPAQTPAAPVEANPADIAEKNIVRCFDAVLGWQAGRYADVPKAKVLSFIRHNAPPPMLAAIRSADFAQVVAVGQDVVLKTPHLLAWISQEENQEFLEEFLNEVRDLDAKLTAEEAAAAKAATTPAEKPAARPAIPVRGKRPPPPAPAPAPAPAQAPAPEAPVAEKPAPPTAEAPVSAAPPKAE